MRMKGIKCRHACESEILILIKIPKNSSLITLIKLITLCVSFENENFPSLAKRLIMKPCMQCVSLQCDLNEMSKIERRKFICSFFRCCCVEN
jgi:hypothetical protein